MDESAYTTHTCLFYPFKACTACEIGELKQVVKHLAVENKKAQEHIEHLKFENRRLREIVQREWSSDMMSSEGLGNRYWCHEGCGFVEKSHRCAQWCYPTKIPKEAVARLLKEPSWHRFTPAPSCPDPMRANVILVDQHPTHLAEKAFEKWHEKTNKQTVARSTKQWARLGFNYGRKFINE